MRSDNDLIDEISQRLESFAAEQATASSEWGSEAAQFTQIVSAATRGGKMLRSRFCAAGWRTAAADSTAAARSILVDVCAGLETFQAAALVHDDIIDNSDTRRGKPAAHRALALWHHENGWDSDSDRFGRSSAILMGDLLLSWSDDLVDAALARRPEVAAAVRAEYSKMRREVMVGQFLDIAEEVLWRSVPQADHPTRALRVASLKSARYSVQQPLAIGATLGGATSTEVETLATYGHDLGLAFQLRDDVLGVFGDEVQTGKPAGDDLREGKRTLLVAYARESLPASDLAIFDARMGDPDLGEDDVEFMRELVRRSGSLARIESDIATYAASARSIVETGPFSDASRAELLALVEATTARAA